MSTVLNKDGSANITLTWSAYSQGNNPASGLIIFWKTGSSAPSALTTADKSVKLPITATTYTFEGVAADLHYRFGIAAYKTTVEGMAIGTIQDHSSWQDVQPATTVKFTGKVYDSTGAKQIVADDGANLARMLFSMHVTADKTIDAAVVNTDNQWSTKSYTTYGSGTVKHCQKYYKNTIDKYIKAEWTAGVGNGEIKLIVGTQSVTSNINNNSLSLDISSLSDALHSVTIHLKTHAASYESSIYDLVLYVTPN